MRKFKVGDRVKIRNFTVDCDGKEGVIDYIYEVGNRFDYIVKVIDGRTIAFFERELEMFYEKEKVIFT